MTSMGRHMYRFGMIYVQIWDIYYDTYGTTMTSMGRVSKNAL
ncbi:hypothetical protein ES702_06172 [subsurface metagenome]